MITYNHASYIAQAIESVLTQRCPFPIELVIGEDHSADETGSIVRQYSFSEPDRVRARLNEQNLGMNLNLQATLGECRGKYIALLEGDDYWTDPSKLTKQVAVLEAWPALSMCFHPVDILENHRLVPDRFTRDVPDITEIMELANGNYMHTCSVVFRADLFADFPQSFSRSPVGDYFLHMLNAQHGPIRKLADKMAVYRVHREGVWSGTKDIDLKILSYLECMIGCFSPEVTSILIERYRRISIQSFLSRLDEPGLEDRFQRCIRYGGDSVALVLAEFAKRQRGSRLSRPFLRIARLLDGLR